MDAIPPSYEYAIMKDALAIIANYIPSADLCSASLVSRRWHAIFNPHLWGDPASHFGTENDAVYVALTRFKRTLTHVRLEVRNLTHTLHLPPALSEIYGGPRAAWLKDLLDRLPRLQSLMVSKLPFFDHNATISLKVPLDSTQAQNYPAYNLRLLLAEGEPNTTSIGLATALSRFSALVYLDLSYTSPARDALVFSVLGDLQDLQVLKLRGIGLRDVDTEFLANAIRTRVRLLDMRNNMLTDTSVRSLLQACFLPTEASQNQTSTLGYHGLGYYQDHTTNLIRSPDLDKKILAFFTRPLTSRSVFENLPPSGITHLYISENRLTVEGVAALLASKRLHVLDAGSVDTAEILKRDQPLLSPPGTKNDFNSMPGAEKLVPILGAYARLGLTHFRINHAVVTKDAPTKSDTAIIELLPELPADELGVHHFHAELDSSHQVYELPADELGVHQFHAELDSSHQVYELPADNDVFFRLEDTSIPSSSATRPNITEKRGQYADELLLPRRGSAFAAEVVSNDNTFDDRDLPQYEFTHIDRMTSSSQRVRKMRELVAKRPKTQLLPLRNRSHTGFPHLHPSHIPYVKTLVLTDVPSHVSANSPILSSLIRFITACADETLLSKLQARADYSVPPGRDRAKAEQQHAKSLFALECLVLEITPVTRNIASKALSPWKPQQHDYASWRSTTGDVDSERLWSAAMDDFSFFGNEECGIPEPHEEIARNILNAKVRLVSDDDSIHSSLSELAGSSTPELDSGRLRSPLPPRSSGKLPSSGVSIGDTLDTAQEPEVDLVSALATFRRAKKSEFETLQKARRQQKPSMHSGSEGSSSPSPSPTPSFDSQATHNALPLYIEGYWPGEVKVIRNPAPKGRSGVVDIYGNYFEKGYLYP